MLEDQEQQINDQVLKSVFIDENVQLTASLYQSGNIELFFIDKKSDETIDQTITFQEMIEFLSHWFSLLSHEQRLELLGKMIASVQCCFPQSLD